MGRRWAVVREDPYTGRLVAVDRYWSRRTAHLQQLAATSAAVRCRLVDLRARRVETGADL